jgi:Group 7 allergen
MMLGPSGWLEGNTDQLTIACDFIVDLTDFMIYMQNFEVTSLGSINITLKGNILVDWLYNTIIGTVSFIP